MKLTSALKDFVSGDDRAVSPVIGVILMVAITVILAAVIGTFVLGLGDSVQTNVQAGASVSANPVDGSDDGTVTVTFNSNQNAAELQVQATDASGNSLDADGPGSTSTILKEVGESVTFTEGSNAENEVRVIVTAVGNDETRTVIVEKTVTI